MHWIWGSAILIPLLSTASGGPDGKWISHGESQRIVGEGLEGTSKPHLLATKINAWQASNHTVEDCLEQVRDNLRVLRRDRVDVLLGHDMEQRRFWKPEAGNLYSGEPLEIDESLDYENAPVIQALREAKAQGFSRYLGLSTNRSEPLAHVLQRVKLDMCLSAHEYSLRDRRSPRVMLPVIREQGIAYLIGGIFCVPGKGVFNGALFKDARLLELARATGVSIAAMSVRFLMANREITTILVGASTPEEIEESVLAAQAGPLPPDIQQTLEALASP
ncbi:aldo/keto reductase [Candidatus Entotheonella palauensis]|uniref:aldo/keto reductase n=1 Tax=Candidatus Entotheonella palauensis TaxID=93172 RepID=UPI000B7DFE73|nr:aldo/keto reductase [Candidatus Entotheonella palauensis]